MGRDQRTGAGVGTSQGGAAQAVDFIGWWFSTLSGMVPGFIRDAFHPVRKWVEVQRTDDTFTVYSVDGNNLGTLASSAKARSRVRSGDVRVLLGPGEAFLRQRRLPASSETNLRSALRLQVAADTPFDIDEVYEDSRIAEPAGPGGMLLAEQAIVRRSLVRELQELARQCRIDLAGIDVAGTDGRPSGFNLLPEADRARSDGFLPSLNRGLAIAAVLLGAVTGGLYTMSLNRELAALEQVTEEFRRDAADVLQLQQSLRARAEAIRLIQEQSASPIRFTTLVDNLATALPADSWLEGLAFDGKRVSLVGLSRSSDGLVARLEDMPGVVAARVVSSVMRDERVGADRFRIELILEEAAPAAPTATPAANFQAEDNG